MSTRLLAVLPMVCLGFLPPCPGADSPNAVTPVCGLLYSSEEIKAVRAEVEAWPALKSVAQDFVDSGTRWTRMTEAEIDGLIPPSSATFARGFAGDPVTNQPWPDPGNMVCSLKRPFEVVSPFNHAVYGIQKPGEEFYDDGSGWVRPADGKRFYFRGIWNSYAIRMLHEAVDDLSISYMLTGDAIFADRALFILDRLATLRSRRPLMDGALDWPDKPSPGFGFFFYEGNLANYRMFSSALAFDLIGKAAAASLPASGGSKLTRFENIRRNYFSVFEAGRLNGSSFQNHSIAAYYASLGQGLLFGSAEKIRQGIEVCCGFLDNVADRDGEYYEQSAMYDGLGRDYGGKMFSLLGHYAPGRYSDSATFPDPEKYPYHLRFGNNPAWFKMAVSSLYSRSTLSRRSQYGDVEPDRVTASTIKAKPSGGKVVYLKLFHYQTDNPEWKELCSKLYWSLPSEARDNKRILHYGVLMWGPSQILQPPKPKDLEISADFRQEASTVAGQKRIAILRSGQGKNQRALFMQGGAGNSHGHDDQMAIGLYANSLSLTGEYGYKLYATPDHVGYGSRAVAHQTVVVDEGRSRRFLASYPPARIEGYLPFGPAQYVEMNNPSLWPASQLSEYRRQTWLVDLSAEIGYFVDFFRVQGGKKHDYVWTAPYLKPSRENSLKFASLNPVPVEGVWSLAGLNPEYRDAVFNQPGQSWGERLEVGSGTIRNLENSKEKVPANHWNPPPGNGYGFIWDIKAAATDREWSATWPLHDGSHSMRMTMLTREPQNVLAGKAPCLAFGCHQDVVIARRESADGSPLKSLFMTVTQTSAEGNWPLKQVEPVKGLGPEEAGALVTHRDGTRDLLIGLNGEGESALSGLRLKGKNAFVRRAPDGEVSVAVLSEGTELTAGDLSIRVPQSAWTGGVKEVRDDRITLDCPLPGAGQLTGHPVLFSSPPDAAVPYSSNEFFTVETVQAGAEGEAVLKFDRQSVRSGRLEIQKKQASGKITTVWPNEVASLIVSGSNPARVFDGHLLQEEGAPPAPAGKSAIITAYLGKKELTVDSPDAIEPGKYYGLMATAPGDRMRIPSFAMLKRQANHSWHVRANMDLEAHFPGSSAAWALESGGREKTTLKADATGTIHIPIALLENGEGLLTPLPDKARTKP